MRLLTTYLIARLGIFLALFALVWLVASTWLAWSFEAALVTALATALVSPFVGDVILRRVRDRIRERSAELNGSATTG